MDEIVFSSLIAFNRVLTIHCDNLSTHHYHVTYLLVSTRNFVTARPLNNIFALLPYLSVESESDRAALLYQRDR